MQVVRGLEGVELLAGALGRRKAFASAAGAGLSVLEVSPKDQKACSELSALIDLIFIGKTNEGPM